jgi:hypothetical protein
MDIRVFHLYYVIGLEDPKAKRIAENTGLTDLPSC